MSCKYKYKLDKESVRILAHIDVGKVLVPEAARVGSVGMTPPLPTCPLPSPCPHPRCIVPIPLRALVVSRGREGLGRSGATCRPSVEDCVGEQTRRLLARHAHTVRLLAHEEWHRLHTRFADH